MVPGSRFEESDASMRERLVNSLSQSFPGSALSRALQCMQPESDSEDDDLKGDFLSSSCFAELRLEKGPIDSDDDLKPLSWLQDSNLLKNIACADEDSEDDQKENGDMLSGNHINQSHPPHVPYNPQKHINSKPPYSFSCLIFMAIEDSPHKRLPVKDIYSWILNHFPYFQHAPTGWKNSVRHNLSLNKCFKKVDKERGQSIGKGSLWCIDPDYRPNLLQALRKTPYHPYHQLQMLANPQPQPQYTYIHDGKQITGPLPLSPRMGPNTVSPHLFPFLSKRLAQSNNNDIDSDIQDVAQTLVSLKGLSTKDNNNSMLQRIRMKRKQRQLGSRSLKRRHLEDVVFTTNPSEDHTYSATSHKDPGSPDSSVDEGFEYGDEDEYDMEEEFSDDDVSYDEWDSEMDEVDGDVRRNHSNAKHRRMTVKLPARKTVSKEDEEEQKKIEEGADALLNLAGIRTTRSSNSVNDSGASSGGSTPRKRRTPTAKRGHIK